MLQPLKSLDIARFRQYILSSLSFFGKSITNMF